MFIGKRARNLGGAWKQGDGRKSSRLKSDPSKLTIAALLRKETTLPLKCVAARVQIGTSKGANAVLHRWQQVQEEAAATTKTTPCAQLEFQSTV